MKRVIFQVPGLTMKYLFPSDELYSWVQTLCLTTKTIESQITKLYRNNLKWDVRGLFQNVGENGHQFSFYWLWIIDF